MNPIAVSDIGENDAEKKRQKELKDIGMHEREEERAHQDRKQPPITPQISEEKSPEKKLLKERGHEDGVDPLPNVPDISPGRGFPRSLQTEAHRLENPLYRKIQNHSQKLHSIEEKAVVDDGPDAEALQGDGMRLKAQDQKGKEQSRYAGEYHRKIHIPKEIRPQKRDKARAELKCELIDKKRDHKLCKVRPHRVFRKTDRIPFHDIPPAFTFLIVACSVLFRIFFALPHRSLPFFAALAAFSRRILAAKSRDIDRNPPACAKIFSAA